MSQKEVYQNSQNNTGNIRLSYRSNRLSNKLSNKPNKSQRGFTLLELMVALVIFAMLSVAGWQVFDGLNRAKDRTKVHADDLSALQYAYLQVQNDMSQVVAWQNEQSTDPKNNNTKSNDINAISSLQQPLDFFELSADTLTLIRFADPDPRYRISPTLIKITYSWKDGQLIRQQYSDVKGSTVAVASVLLSEVQEWRWQALLPEPTFDFSSADVQASYTTSESANSNKSRKNNNGQDQNNPLLPKGVMVNFKLKEQPLQWTFMLPEPSPELVVKYMGQYTEPNTEPKRANQPANNQTPPNGTQPNSDQKVELKNLQSQSPNEEQEQGDN